MSRLHLMVVGCVWLPTVAAGSRVQAATFELKSAAFAANAEIPVKNTCKGSDVSPALAWSAAPRKTKSFVLIVDDPDAPDPAAATHTFVHWVVYNLPADTTSLGEGVRPPSEARFGVNDFGSRAYRGPCPPRGRHRYFFKLYALDTQLAELASANKATVEEAMQGHVLAQAQLVGTFKTQ